MALKVKSNGLTWTQERRMEARERIARVKPWEKCAGAKTEAGLKRSGQNARTTPEQKELKRICRILGISWRDLKPGQQYVFRVPGEQMFWISQKWGDSPATLKIRMLERGGWNLRMESVTSFVSPRKGW